MPKEKKVKLKTVTDRTPNLYERTASDILNITEDKLKLKLLNFEASIKSKADIFCSIGVFVALLVALLTADFKDFLFKKEIWKAIFIVSTSVSIIWMVKSLLSYFKNRKDLDSLIEDIKTGR